MSCVLFYSKYCKYSKKFINILQKSGVSPYFVKVCVDRNNNGKRDKAVKEYKITEVPTVIAEDNKLVGYNAFQWLNQQIELMEEGENANQGAPNKNAVKNNNKTENSKGGKKELDYFSLEKSFKGDLDCNFVQINDDDNFCQTVDASVDDETAEMLRRQANFKIPNAGISNLTEGAGEHIREPLTPPVSKNVNIQGTPDVLRPIVASKDKLKSKQIENTYNKLLQERQDVC